MPKMEDMAIIEKLRITHDNLVLPKTEYIVPIPEPKKIIPLQLPELVQYSYISGQENRRNRRKFERSKKK